MKALFSPHYIFVSVLFFCTGTYAQKATLENLCVITQSDRAELLKMADPEEFDFWQNGWKKFVKNCSDSRLAILMILEYRDVNKHLMTPLVTAWSMWHIGQQAAQSEMTEYSLLRLKEGLELIKQLPTTGNDHEIGPDPGFYDFAYATLAFLERNHGELLRRKALVDQLPDTEENGYTHFKKSVKGFVECYDKPFYEAYRICSQR